MNHCRCWWWWRAVPLVGCGARPWAHWWVEVVDCDGEPLSALVGCWAIVGIEGAGGFSMAVGHIVVCSCPCLGHCCAVTIVWLLSSCCIVVGFCCRYVVLCHCCVASLPLSSVGGSGLEGSGMGCSPLMDEDRQSMHDWNQGEKWGVSVITAKTDERG